MANQLLWVILYGSQKDRFRASGGEERDEQRMMKERVSASAEN